MTTPNLYIVKPVYKAVQLLQTLADAQTDLTLASICKRTQLPKTTAYKYLQTFMACGYVAYDLDSESYRLGMRLYELGRLANKQATLQRVALPLMIALRDRFDESVNLAVLDGSEVLCIESVNSTQTLRMQTPPGTREGVHATSLGKAMLAFLDEGAWDKHLRGPLKTHTSRTVTQPIQIKTELRKTRSRGYAIDNQETTHGAYCVGAPIFNKAGRIEAGISISAPVNRMTTRREKEFGKAVMDVAAEITRQF